MERTRILTTRREALSLYVGVLHRTGRWTPAALTDAPGGASHTSAQLLPRPHGLRKRWASQSTAEPSPCCRYRDILRYTALFVWRDDTGRMW